MTSAQLCIPASSDCLWRIHNHAQTGDLISRVTSDIDSVQSFITGGLLSASDQYADAGGMIGVMFYMNLALHADCAVRRAVTFLVVFRYTRLIKKNLPGRCERRKDRWSPLSRRFLPPSGWSRPSPGRLRAKTSGRRKPGKCRAIAARAQPEGQAVAHGRDYSSPWGPAWCCFSARGWCWPARWRPVADCLHLVPREDVQAHAGAFQDDGRLFEGCRGI